MINKNIQQYLLHYIEVSNNSHICDLSYLLLPLIRLNFHYVFTLHIL